MGRKGVQNIPWQKNSFELKASGNEEMQEEAFHFPEVFYLPKELNCDKSSPLGAPHPNRHRQETTLSPTCSPQAPLSLLQVICFP